MTNKYFLSLLTVILTVVFSLCFSPAQSTVKQQDASVVFPEIILSGIEVDVVLQFNEAVMAQLNDTNMPLRVNGKNIALPITDGKIHIPHVFQEEEMFTVNCDKFEYKRSVTPMPLWLSIVPPLLAILIALVFREVYSALFAGLWVGTSILYVYAGSSFLGIFKGLFAVVGSYVVGSLNDSSHLSIIIFSMLIGGMVAIVTKNGGMMGVVKVLSRFAKGPRSGQLVTWALGIAIFFDDYANTLVVGNTMRPITDKLKISREKLSYLVDSTAAPVAAIAFVTTWIGAELGYIEGAISEIPQISDSEGVYSIFINSLQYAFYPIFTLIFIFMLVIKRREFGPMLKAERKVREADGLGREGVSVAVNHDATMEELEPEPGIKFRGINAILPVLVVIFGTITGLLITGIEACQSMLLDNNVVLNGDSFFEIWNNLHLLPKSPESFIEKLGTVIGYSDSYSALLWSSLLAVLVAVILTVFQRIMKLAAVIEITIKGFKTMLNAVLILILAWSLAALTKDMHTADFITGLLGENIQPWLVPMAAFILASIISFATGSSWGTMAILYPLLLPAAWKVCQLGGYSHEEAMMIFYNVVSTVLAGSVLGDHCSPISDTTILSSLACSCNHIDHVKTQLPYAFTVGMVSLLAGTLPAAFGISPMILYPTGTVLMWLIIHFIGKRIDLAIQK